MKGGCEKCLFYDVCKYRRRCSDYAPTDGNRPEDILIEISRRTEFYKEWNEYIYGWCDTEHYPE